MSKKYNGMKRARDWIGQPIRITRTMRNGAGEYPVGTRGIVQDLWRGGLSLALFGCDSCQSKDFITRVDYGSVELDLDLIEKGPAHRESLKFRAATLLNSGRVRSHDGRFVTLELELPEGEGRRNARQLRDLAHALHELAELEDALNREPEHCNGVEA